MPDSSRCKIADNVSLAGGDIFLSPLHSVAIPVNTVGVMGKGLAAQARAKFPDVDKQYRRACREKLLTPQTPFLCKPDGSRWFLMFATKRHWRDPSRLEDIVAGLRWVEENYEREGIKSLALPALGCGLGGLKWAKVGPLMCQTLARMKIQSAIYLPREEDIPDAQKTSDFLLGKSGL